MSDTPWCNDGISLRNLRLEHTQRVGSDAWGRQKAQPLLLSVNVSFRRSFATAADKDALDESTLHYGLLAKRLRALNPVDEWESLDSFAQRVHDDLQAYTVALDIIEACQVVVHLPKASLLGQAVSFSHSVSYATTRPQATSKVLHLEAVSVPVLIGVNANERTRKQPLLFYVWIHGIPSTGADIYASLENAMAQVSVFRLWCRKACSS